MKRRRAAFCIWGQMSQTRFFWSKKRQMLLNGAFGSAYVYSTAGPRTSFVWQICSRMSFLHRKQNLPLSSIKKGDNRQQLSPLLPHWAKNKKRGRYFLIGLPPHGCGQCLLSVLYPWFFSLSAVRRCKGEAINLFMPSHLLINFCAAEIFVAVCG